MFLTWKEDLLRRERERFGEEEAPDWIPESSCEHKPAALPWQIPVVDLREIERREKLAVQKIDELHWRLFRMKVFCFLLLAVLLWRVLK